MKAKERPLYETVETGIGCDLNLYEEKNARFNRVILRSQEPSHPDSLFLTQHDEPSNYRSEPLPESTTYEEVDEAFRACPCHDPVNAGRRLGKAGCLALKELTETVK